MAADVPVPLPGIDPEPSARPSSSHGRRRILERATFLFAAFGYDRVSTKRIAAEAGFTIGALFHHFPTKTSLYAAVLHDVLEGLPAPPLSTENDDDARDALERLVAWFTEITLTDTPAVQLLRREFTDPRLPVAISEMPTFEAASLRFRQLVRRVAPGANPLLAEAAVNSLIFGIVGLPGLRRIAPGTIYSSTDPQKVASEVCAIIFEGIPRASDTR